MNVLNKIAMLLVLTTAAILVGEKSQAEKVFLKGSQAPSELLKYDRNSSYVVVFGKDFGGGLKKKPSFLRGVFCPVKNSVATSCEKEEAIVVGERKTALWGTASGNLIYTVQRIPAGKPGRLAMTSAKGATGNEIRMRGATYEFTPQKGVVFVLGPANLTFQDSQASVRKYLVENFSPEFSSVSYKPMSAVQADCTSKKRLLGQQVNTCILGARVDPRSVPRK